MPRGVYDRSKAKKKTAQAVETQTEPKQKRKYTKRANKLLDTAGEALKVAKSLTSMDELHGLTAMLGNLCSLQAAGHQIVSPLIKKVYKTLDGKFDGLFGEPALEGSNGAEEKPVTSLPTPEKFVIPPPPAAS